VKTTSSVVLVFALFWPSPAALAQTTYAGITGTVIDPNGAVVPNVTIEATHTQTNYKYTAQSNEVGVYTLSQLREGEYTLRARASGFQEFAAQNILWFANNRSGYKLLCCNAFITVVESAELWNCNDLSVAQRLSRKRTLFIEAQMGSRIMVVVEITRQRSFEVSGVQNDVVIQTLPSNGAD
jgi:hypothetical protein